MPVDVLYVYIKPELGHHYACADGLAPKGARPSAGIMMT